MNHRMKRYLLLGSQSQSRQMLLRESHIPFKLIAQSADESQCDWGLPLEQVVKGIALYKMEHALIPDDINDKTCFVLTADTLSQDKQGRISGKPTSKEQAIEMVRRARSGMRTATAFCVERKVKKGDTWQTDKQIIECVWSKYVFDIPDDWMETYFNSSNAFIASGAIAIENFGGQFLKTIDGSYSTIIGLPLFEVRQALTQLGFFE